MTKRLLRLLVLAVVVGPAVGAASTLGPIVFPTGPWEDPEDRIGEEPPPDPDDPGGICPRIPESF
jgi:hypothetical protein